MRLALVTIGALVPAIASAQMPTVDPSGQTPPAPPPTATPGSYTGVPGGIYGIDQPAPPPPPPEIRVIVPPGGQVEQEGKNKEPEGLWIAGPHRGPKRETPPVPEMYQVQRGDTLWEISGQFFGDPYVWPRLWAMNPSITNPHWIYPGDLIRLREPGGAPASQPAGATSAPTLPQRAREPARLRRLAFVSTADLATSAEIVGSTQEQVMLATGDEVYLTYPEGKPPQVAQEYAIYSPQKDIKHPITGGKVGAYVLILGTLRVLDVKKGKNAHAVIVDVTNEGTIERGNRVGALKTQFQAVQPVPPDKSVEGVIVAILHVDQLVGEGDVVVIDRGRRDGVVVGNTMLAVRRGDALVGDYGTLPAGLDDHRYPDKYIADIILLDVADAHALGLCTRTDKELLIGDHVLMRASAK
jgi:hypothetical protein